MHGMTATIATHQPIFLPWPGLFHKAALADSLVLLDDVQFPRGRSWLTRNRLKSGDGEVWLKVPVLRKGRDLQRIGAVEVCDDTQWRRKHLESIRHYYARAPYFGDYYPLIEGIYMRGHRLLSELNYDLISFLLGALSIRTGLLRQSELGVRGRGTDLLLGICGRLGAARYLSLRSASKHVDEEAMGRSGIELVRTGFEPPVYPQLWGEFIYNLSALDLLLNCGPRSRDMIPGGATGRPGTGGGS